VSAADREPPGRRDARAPVPAGERRYTEEELALILNRAAERQEGMQPSAPRYTLVEIQEIAAGAGIAPEHVANVAATIRDARAPQRGGVLGAPERFHFEESIDGEITDDVVGELLDLVRRDLGVQGSVTEALGSIEWKGQDVTGMTFVTVTRRGGRTTIGVLSARTDAAGVTWTLGGMGAIAGSAALATVLVAVVGMTGPAVGALAIAGGGSGAWLSARSFWKRFARRWSERTNALGTALVAAARRAVEEGRVSA